MARILVVEDEEALSRLFVRRLAQEGFEVAGATSGPEGLALAERSAPDLIILDLCLPGMHGLEVLRRLRARGETAKVLILTGYGTAQWAREALALGATEFLGKPFDLDRLLAVVAEEVSAGVSFAACE